MNHGLNLELEKQHRKPEDWEEGQKLGGEAECVALIPLEGRRKYLPQGEIQRGKEDMMDCASRAPVNIAEAKLNYLYHNYLLPPATKAFFETRGFVTAYGIEIADAWIAIKSGTGREGNSLIAPFDAVHRFGIAPKRLLPLLPTMTFDEYHDPNRITPLIEEIAKQSLEHLSFNYKRVYLKDFAEMRKKDLFAVGGYAWLEPVNGVYERAEYDFNHAYVNFAPEIEAFDNYPDSFDGDFIKNLAPDYRQTDFGYRLIIGFKKKPDNGANTGPETPETWFDAVIGFIKGLKKLFTGS